MESREHKEGFENFLKEKADSYKMYPSERIWSNLTNKLHPRKKWPYTVVAVIFLGLGFGGKIYDSQYSLSEQQSNSPLSIVATEEIKTPEVNEQQLYRGNSESDDKSNMESLSDPAKKQAIVVPIRSIATRQNSFPANNISHNNSDLNTPGQLQKSKPGTDLTSLLEKPSLVWEGSEHPFSQTVNPEGTANNTASKASPGKTSAAVIVSAEQKNINASTGQNNLTASTEPKNASTSKGKNNLTAFAATSSAQKNQTAAGLPLTASIIVTDPSAVNAMEENMGPKETSAKSIKVKKHQANNLGWQLYFSPTMSYRKLSGSVNKYSLANASNFNNFRNNSPTDLNSAVTQTPSVGMELGTAILYNVSKRVRIKGGLQFNYSQYSISAYDYSEEVVPMSVRGIGHTEIDAISYHRNFDGFSNAELHNEHFMISVPIGAELTLIGNKVVQFNIAGTLQPGVMLNNQAYMLSTDLKNYAKMPSLYRTFNINTALEAYVSVQLGSLKWSVGPQFRYQLLSSYKKEYPIKEHLYDYGIKLGMTKTLK